MSRINDVLILADYVSGTTREQPQEFGNIVKFADFAATVKEEWKLEFEGFGELAGNGFGVGTNAKNGGIQVLKKWKLFLEATGFASTNGRESF